MGLFQFWDNVEIEVSCRLNCDFQLPIDFGGIMLIETLSIIRVDELLPELSWLLIGRWLLPFEVVFEAWKEQIDPEYDDPNEWLFDVKDLNKFWFLLEGIESGIVE